MPAPHTPSDELITVRDWLRYAVSRFNAEQLVYGHGPATALDEAAYLADRILVMSCNPGRVVEFIENPVPRPRSPSQFISPEYLALKQRLEEHIHPVSETPEKLPMIKMTEAGDEVE